MQAEQEVLIKATITDFSTQIPLVSRSYWIPAGRFAELSEKLGWYAERSEKLGLVPLSIEQIDEREEDCIREICVKITGSTPRLPDWTFVASLDHLKEGNVVRVAPGVDAIPEQYRTIKSQCDHCNTNRTRNATYVVRNNAGEYRQIGKSCLKEFLGHPYAEELAMLAAWQADLLGFLETAGSGPIPGETEKRKYLLLVEYLPFVAKQIREEGWTSKGTAYANGGLSTAVAAKRDMRDMEVWPTAEDYATAANAVGWAKALETSDEGEDLYLHNLHVLASNGIFHSKKHDGIAAALVMSYMRKVEEEYIAHLPDNTDRLGAPGARVELADFTVERIFVRNTKYGTTSVHYFRDAAGQVLSWASTTAVLDIGVPLKITGTVKAYERWPVLTRVQVKG